MARRTTILSVNGNPTYAWFVPLCTLMWRDICGFGVSCVYVGPTAPWLVDKAREVGTLVHEYEHPPCCSSPTMSQLVRLFSYLLPDVASDDYLLSVDADAWPLADAFQPSGYEMDLIYPAAADYAETPYFPIGYIGARASVWREIVGIEAVDVRKAIIEMYQTDPTLVSGHSGWNYDETYITRKIKALWARRRVEISIRKRAGDPPEDRIDRACWPNSPIADGHMDAHLIRPGWTEKNWPRLRPLLAQRLSAEHLAWADAYRAESLTMLSLDPNAAGS